MPVVPGQDIAQDAANQFTQFASDALNGFVQSANQAIVQPALDDFNGFASGLVSNLGKAGNPQPLDTSAPPQVTSATASALSSGADPANLAWARANMGRSDYIGYCEQFVENANGVTGKYPSAIAAAQAQPLSTDWSQARPGDTVYYGAAPENGGYGHAAIYSGNGKVVSSAANHETPLTGYFNAPLLGFVPSTDNQHLDASP